MNNSPLLRVTAGRFAFRRNADSARTEGANALSLAAYLTAQIQEIIGLGSGHALIWASRAQWRRQWLQLSVHDGAQRYVSVQFLQPRGISKRRLDRVFGTCGWRQMQADRSDCLLYYIARCSSQERLFAQAEAVARQCAEVMRLLWDIEEVGQIFLPSARGPRLPLSAMPDATMSVMPRAT